MTAPLGLNTEEISSLVRRSLTRMASDFGFMGAALSATGDRQKVKDLLLRGKITPGSELTPLHPVTRGFDPPALVLVDGQPAGRVGSISATVGEEQADPLAFTIDGRRTLAWMVKETLGGARAWFTTDGQTYLTE